MIMNIIKNDERSCLVCMFDWLLMNTKKIAWYVMISLIWKVILFLMEYNTLCFVNITMMIIWYADYNWNFCACSCLTLPCLCKVSMLTYLWIREKCQQSKKPTRSNDHPLSTALLHHNLKSILIFLQEGNSSEKNVSVY